MKRYLKTPIRRLDGVTYWVIKNSDGIYDFVNGEIRKEWEADATFEGRDPKQDLWLRTFKKKMEFGNNRDKSNQTES